MVRCVTAHQLWKQDVVTSPPGDVYHSTAGWWLLVNSLDESSLVSPGTLLISLQNIRTLVELDNTLCFRLAKIFRSKIHIQHWLQLLAIIFCRQAKIGLLDKQPYTFETPVTVLEAFAVVRDWSTTNMGNRPLRQLSSARSSSHCRACDTVQSSRRAPKKTVNHAAESPPELPSMDLVRQHRHITSTRHCSFMSFANFDSRAAMTRYAIREYGQEAIFRRQPTTYSRKSFTLGLDL